MDQRIFDPSPAASPETLAVQPLLPGADLPLLVTSKDGALDDDGWRNLLPDIRAVVRERLHGDASFRAFAESFGRPLLDYDFGSTPRSAVDKGVDTSTEYPAHQSIPLHNEQAYILQWPQTIWFHCVTAATTGGATPIADSRLVARRINPAIRARFAAKRLMYVRNYGNGLELPWQRAFNTDDPAEVERFCRANAIAWEWTRTASCAPARSVRRWPAIP
ncbi:TauD/TfdA family dioxygenase [Azospirillum sp. A1-3]|uniref:TauD/TfdA family dioxygenase n=1 Tax=Azospirillum sp. A1-3 TaxID=185874 RepID=UPI002076F995|nr:TauD/TfdA family dioxygenase [Azospirillum sp. A1-3]MCM8735795.1 TauD/TfdA family dioxygenase [Azospirillum sp. A1-3]